MKSGHVRGIFLVLTVPKKGSPSTNSETCLSFFLQKMKKAVKGENLQQPWYYLFSEVIYLFRIVPVGTVMQFLHERFLPDVPKLGPSRNSPFNGCPLCFLYSDYFISYFLIIIRPSGEEPPPTRRYSRFVS